MTGTKNCGPINRSYSEVFKCHVIVKSTTIYLVGLNDFSVFFDFNNLGNFFAVNVPVCVAVVSRNRRGDGSGFLNGLGGRGCGGGSGL